MIVEIKIKTNNKQMNMFQNFKYISVDILKRDGFEVVIRDEFQYGSLKWGEYEAVVDYVKDDETGEWLLGNICQKGTYGIIDVVNYPRLKSRASEGPDSQSLASCFLPLPRYSGRTRAR